MTDTAAMYPGTTGDDSSIGTVAWSSTDNIKVSDSTGATADVNGVVSVIEESIKIIKGGVISGTDQSTGGAITGSYATYTFGSSSNLWGLSWAASDINATTFGVAISYTGRFAATSHYITATNFGFSIPTGATINGIKVECSAKSFGTPLDVDIDFVRITVSYTISLILSESFTLGDGTQKSDSIWRPETTQILDYIRKNPSQFKTETVSLADSLRKSDSIFKGDTFAFADSLRKSDSLNKSETLALAESIRKANTIPKTETLTTSESTAKLFSKTFIEER